MISIVTPMYNASAYLEDTIRSVLDQTYTDWEWILVDDCSADDSMEIAQRAAASDARAAASAEAGSGRIRLLQMPENGGPAKARNAGIDAARGEYLAFLDADDIWKSVKLEHELSFLKDQKAAFVCHAYEFGDEAARETGKTVRPPAKLTYERALTRTVIFTSTVMFDLSQFTREELHMPDCHSEDTALWWRILRGGTPCLGLDEVLAIYRRSSQSLSSNKARAVRNIWQLYRRQEGLGVIKSAACTAGWAARAALRRL